MVVSELRELLKKYKEEDLRLIISQMYKAMPKKLREEKDIDAFLQDAHAYLNIGKVNRNKDIQIDINALKPEIEEFIDYGYKQYYLAPNNIIHKKERPKWRFKVKAYIKSLQVISVDCEEGKFATELLEKLYNMLGYACDNYIFNTEDPFRSVGIEQVVFLDMVIKRKLESGISKEVVKSAIELVINSSLDRETIHSWLIMVLVSNLKSTDSKEICVQQCEALRVELDRPKPNLSRKSWDSNSIDYLNRKKIDNLVEIIFRLNMELFEYEKAIEYYNKNNKYNKNGEDEVSLYVLLDMLLEYEMKDYWIKEYEAAVKKGVKPRESLQRTYQYIKENDKLPD